MNQELKKLEERIERLRIESKNKLEEMHNIHNRLKVDTSNEELNKLFITACNSCKLAANEYEESINEYREYLKSNK